MGLTACFQGLLFDTPVYVSAATALGLVLLVAWMLRHEDFAGRRYFLATVIGMILWVVMATAEMMTPGLLCKTVAAAATWPAIALVPVAWTLFMWRFCFSPPERWVRAETLLVLGIVIAVSTVAFSNPWHGLFYGPDTRLVVDAGRPHAEYDHGPLFHAVAAVLYLFLICGFAMATTAAFRASRSLRPLMFMLMCATMVPMVSNFAYVALGADLSGFDPTPFAFSFVLLALTWAIYATRGMDLVSLARDLLYFNILDPVLVVNAQGRVVGANAAASRIMPQVAQGETVARDGPLGLIPATLHAADPPAGQSDIVLGGRRFTLRVLPIPRPLTERGDHLGAVAILSDVTELESKNALLAAALEKSQRQVAEISRLREIAETSAMSDPLTKVGNRRSLEARVAELGAAPFGLALIDLDHFKAINDRLGHVVGDRVLKEFAATARDVLPPGAEIFRVGGEEFAVLVAGAPMTDLVAMLLRLRERLADAVSLRDRDAARVTFSAGVAACPADGDTLDQLYARADSRLYQAKRNGRDLIMHLDILPFDGDGAIRAFPRSGSAVGE